MLLRGCWQNKKRERENCELCLCLSEFDCAVSLSLSSISPPDTALCFALAFAAAVAAVFILEYYESGFQFGIVRLEAKPSSIEAKFIARLHCAKALVGMEAVQV